MTRLAIGGGTPPEDWGGGASWTWLDQAPDEVMAGGPPSADARRSSDYRTAAESYLAAMEEANDLLAAWGLSVRDAKGRALREMTMYRDCSLWTAVDVRILYSMLADLIDRHRLWERVLAAERPEAVWIGAHPDARLVESLARARKIPVAGDRAMSAHAVRQGGTGSAPLSRRLARWTRPYRHAVSEWRARRHNGSRPSAPRRGGAPLVLVLTVVRRFVDIVIPVIRALQRDRRADVVVVDRNFSTACLRLEEERIPFVVWEGFGTSAGAARSRTEADRFAALWAELRRDEAFRSGFVYHDTPLWPFLDAVLDDQFADVFPELVRVMETTTNLLQTLRPDATVLTDDRPPFQRMFVAACREAGVPTINVQNSVLSGFIEGGPMTTDWVAVDGEASRDNVRRRGTAPAKVVVTGQPRFDFLGAPRDGSAQARARRVLGLDRSKPVALVASQQVGVLVRAEDKRKAFRAVYAAFARVPEVQLIVKLHPEDCEGAMERGLAVEAGLATARMCESGDIWPLIEASDLVIVFCSTVGYEAIALDKPLIQIHLDGAEGACYRYTDQGAALEVARLETLEEQVRSALWDPDVQARLRKGREAYRQSHMHRLDGRAAERVAALVCRAARAR